MKDLTKGKISTLILGFAIPVFLGNLYKDCRKFSWRTITCCSWCNDNDQ